MSIISKQELMGLISSIRVNYRGTSIKRKIIILESDDWGAIRTPSREALDIYSKAGVNLENSYYKNDCLETNNDIERLFEVLTSVKDSNGNLAAITANTIVANPDFDKIKESNFENYFYEPFTTTYNKYKDSSNVFNLFQQGLENDIFVPQFHGREHLNIRRWLYDLKNDNKRTRLSFDLGSTYSGEGDYSYMGAFEWESKSELEEQKQILRDGLHIFKTTFGFDSKSFIPPCYSFDSELYGYIHGLGIDIIQGIRVQLEPTGKLNKYKKSPHYFGEKHNSGLKFNIRNCFFEPVFNSKIDWVDSCLKSIHLAFLFSKPAVIATHRINYISSILKSNGDTGLFQLQRLLKEIVKKWPEVEFTTTDKVFENGNS